METSKSSSIPSGKTPGADAIPDNMLWLEDYSDLYSKAARQLQDQCQTQKYDLNMAFVNLTI